MISVNFTSDVENVVATEHLYQWDNGQKLRISGAGTNADIHFANKKSEKALVVTPTVTSGEMVAFIPNSLLADPYPILAYVYVPSDNGSKTIKSVTIYVEARKQPSDFVLEEDEGITTVEAISQRVNAIMSSIQTDYNNFKNTIQAELDEMKNTTTVPNALTLNGMPLSNGSGGIGIPFITGDNGVMDIGNYIDFHYDGSKDYNMRLQTGGAGNEKLYLLNSNNEIGNIVANFDGNAITSTLAYHLYEHILEKDTDILAYAKLDDCTHNTVVRIINSKNCPTNYGYDESNNDFFYVIYKLDNSYITIKGYDIRTNFEFVRSCIGGNWTDWIRSNDGGNANSVNGVKFLVGTAKPQVKDPNAEGYVPEGAWYGQYEEVTT